MKTKKDFWMTMLLSYVLIFAGIIMLYVTWENKETEIYILLAIIVVEILGLITIGRALKIFRGLEDKSVYPKQLDFLNRIAAKLYSDKKTSNTVMAIAITVGAVVGIIIGLNL